MSEFFRDAKKQFNSDQPAELVVTIDQLAVAYVKRTHDELVEALPQLRNQEIESKSFTLPTLEHDLVDKSASSSDQTAFLHALNTAIITTVRRRYELREAPSTIEDEDTIFHRWMATVVECQDDPTSASMLETTETSTADGQSQLPIEVSFRIAMPDDFFELLLAHCDTDDRELTPTLD